MKKVVISAITLGSIALLVLAFIYFSKPDKLTEKERQEAIDKVVGGKANLNGPEVKTGSGIYKGKHAEFSYPASAEIYDYKDPNSVNSDPESESFSFDIKSPRLVFNYNASATREVKLEDISAVKFRNDPANGYANSEEKVDGVIGVSFKKDRSGEYMAEKTLFVLNNGNLITISITGSSLEEVENLFDSIKQTLKFN